MEARSTADIYDGLMFYGSYGIFYFGFVNALGTVSVFYEIDNFLNVDYGPRHDYVVELCIVLVDRDNFFLRKYGCFGMFAVLGHAS